MEACAADPYAGPRSCLENQPGKELKDVATKCGKASLVHDPCYFCQTCAKLAGEVCGGSHSEYGRCDKGLECMNGTEVMDGSNGIGTCYYNATKGLGEECGGAFGRIGRCTAGLLCNVSDTSAHDVQGVCLDESAPGACFKNCIERDSMEVCGNDGRVYRNKCELRKQNCLIPPGRQPHKIKSTDMSLCNQACENVVLQHERAIVNYTYGVLNGSTAVIGCEAGYRLQPSSVILLQCLSSTESTSGQNTKGEWHRRVEHSDGRVEWKSGYSHTCIPHPSSDILDYIYTDQ